MVVVQHLSSLLTSRMRITAAARLFIHNADHGGCWAFLPCRYDQNPVPEQQSSTKPRGARLSTRGNPFSCSPTITEIERRTKGKEKRKEQKDKGKAKEKSIVCRGGEGPPGPSSSSNSSLPPPTATSSTCIRGGRAIILRVAKKRQHRGCSSFADGHQGDARGPELLPQAQLPDAFTHILNLKLPDVAFDEEVVPELSFVPSPLPTFV